MFGQFAGVVLPDRRAASCLSTVGSNANPSAVIAQYPITNYQQSVGRALTAIGTDALFACPGRRAAQALSKFVPTYAYEFNDPNAPQLFVPPASFPYEAYHASRDPVPVRLAEPDRRHRR